MSNDITLYNLKPYTLILERNPATGEFEYSDFVRPADRSISEEKHEIRYNIANHGMDKQAESLVAEYIKKHRAKFKVSDRIICVRIGWNDNLKSAVLVDVAIYK